MRALFTPGTTPSMKRRGRKNTVSMIKMLGLVSGIASPSAGRSKKRKSTGSVAKAKPRKPGSAGLARSGRDATDRSKARPSLVFAPSRGGSFRTAEHRCEHGQRRYKIFTPSRALGTAEPLPLLIMLHGCSQTPDDFAKGTRMNALAEELGLFVVYPAQPSRAHPTRCWNWFRPGDQVRDAGEPALIASLTGHVLDSHPVDRSRVYVAGLSAGASAALVLAAAYPEVFAAVGAHSGLPVGAARDNASAMIAMQRGNPGQRLSAAVPTIAFSGSVDHVVNPRNARFIAIRALESFPSLRAKEIAGRAPDGHSYLKTTHRVGKGRPLVEQWVVKGCGHAWSGGSKGGRFTDPAGPDASREMLRFFLRHRLPARRRRKA